jgi:DNA-nicking Smr family endonuclease
VTRRKLTPEEMALWRKVAETAERITPETQSSAPTFTRPKPRPNKTATPRIEPFEIGARSNNGAPGHDVLPGLPDRIARQPLKMDKKTHARLKRGKMLPEGRIDLHGMTMERAHPALTGFILNAQAQGKRLVLVITGKGKRSEDDGPIPRRPGVLRHAVPQWLSMPPLAQAVLQVAEAHAKHGGGGAYYVYLRRPRQ